MLAKVRLRSSGDGCGRRGAQPDSGDESGLDGGAVDSWRAGDRASAGSAEAERIFRRAAERDPAALDRASDCCTCSVCNNGRPRRGPCSGRCIKFATTRGFWSTWCSSCWLINRTCAGLRRSSRNSSRRRLKIRSSGGPGGWVCSIKGGHPEALPHLEAAARLLVNDPLGRFALAECRILLAKPVEIDEVLGRIPEQSNDAAQWWLLARSNRGDDWAARAGGRVVRASGRAAGRRVVKLHFRLGQLLKRLGTKRAARRATWTSASRIDERIKVVRREHQSLRKEGLPSDAKLFERLGAVVRRGGDGSRVSRVARAVDQTRAGRSRTRGRSSARLAGVSDAVPFALPHPKLAVERK